VNVSPEGGGAVDIGGARPAAYPFSTGLDNGTEIDFTAVSSFWYRFTGWSGDLEGAENPSRVVIDCEKEITAHFALNWLLISGLASSLAVAVFLVVVLVIRRK
jgi:hypothetical protein